MTTLEIITLLEKLSGQKPVLSDRQIRFSTVNKMPGFEIIADLTYKYRRLPHTFIFGFLDEIVEDKKYISFGRHHGYNWTYSISKKNHEIIAIDDDGDIAMRCAKDLNSFLAAYKRLLNMEIVAIEKPGLEEYYLSDQRIALIKELGGDEFKEFAKHAIVLESDFE